MGNKNIPEIRFKGFSDTWEQRKLGDIAEIKDSARIPNTMWKSEGVPYLRSSDLATGHIDGELFLSLEDYKDYASKTGSPEKGDLLFASGGDIGLAIYKDTEFPVYVQGGSILYVRTSKSKNLEGPFLQYSFESPRVKSYIKGASTGTSLKHFVLKPANALPISFPALVEQKKIGTFFKQLDNTIALHQRKLDKLKCLKKSYLQKMFPRNGETKPELRFDGFTDAWEQRKFEDCFSFPVSTNSLSRAMLNYDTGEVKNVHYGDVLIKYPSILDIKKEEVPYITNGALETYNSNLLKNGDLIFADAAEDETVGKAVEINGITNEILVSGLHTIVARATKQKAEFFLGYYINSDAYHRQLLRLMQGSKVSAISKGNLQKTDVSFPRDIEEQKKIGTFFKQLDNTITLHQRKLDKLKRLKTFYLQKMFV